MSMTPKERVIATMNREKPDRLPYVELTVDANVAVKTIELLGKEVEPELKQHLDNRLAAFAGGFADPVREYLKGTNKADVHICKALHKDNAMFMNSF